MKKLLAVAAVGELVTGLAFLVAPSLVAQLLLGVELTGVALRVELAASFSGRRLSCTRY